MKHKPYIPRPWQLPHLLATPLGGTVLLVEQCEEQPPPCKGFPREANGEWGIYLDRPHAGPYKHIGKCPLGSVGTVLSIEGVGDFRTTAIDLKKTSSMTPNDAMLWGGDRLWKPPTTLEKIRRLEKHYESQYPGSTWGDWAWFVTAERVDRT